VGTTPEGHPWIGAGEPVLVVEEFSDYQCPYCQKGHDQMRKLVQDHPDRVQLVHRNYPLDQSCNGQLKRPFHPYACQYAAMAVCAQKQGRFWEANDYLFSKGRRRKPVTVGELAWVTKIKADRLAECVDSQETARHIQHDLEAGRALNIRGTPTYVIGDRSYPGAIPPDVLSAALRE
jgi:protein-disulfide isomerase